MTLTDTTKKRPRNEEDEESDFLPLSKRINNLKIRTNNPVNGVDANQSASHLNKYVGTSTTSQNGGVETRAMVDQHKVGMPNQWGHVVHNHSSLGLEQPSGSGMNMPHDVQHNSYRHYGPELDAAQNPHYYEINSVLFHAHVERMQRLGLNSNGFGT